MRIRVLRIYPYSCTIPRTCSRPIALLKEGIPHIEVSLDIVGPEPDRIAVFRNRFICLALFIQGQAQGIVQQGTVRPQPHDFPVLGNRSIEIARSR